MSFPLTAKRHEAVAMVLVTLVALAMALAFVVMPYHICIFAGLLALRASGRDRRAPPPWVGLTMRDLVVGARSFALADVRAISTQGTSVVLLTSESVFTLDLQHVDAGFACVFVRHLEARVRLARGPARSRAESVALEAFHVHDAWAVRMRGRGLHAILPREGPWPRLHPRDRIYVRELPVRGTPYRSASPDVVALGSL